MAHKTAFTAQSLAAALEGAAFSGGVVLRDSIFGLRSVSVKEQFERDFIEKIVSGIAREGNEIIQTLYFGSLHPQCR